MQNSNLFWTIVGVVGGGILSLVITLVVQRYSNRKFIVYEITTLKYFSSDNSRAFFSSEGAFIDSMHISIVKISTRSSGLIRNKDFVPDQPLTLTDIDAPGEIFAIKQGGFLNIHRRYLDKVKSYPKAQLAIEHISKDKAILDFDYIEKNRPLEFLVFHDAKLRVEGKLIDGMIKEKVPFSEKLRNSRLGSTFMIILMVICMISMAYTFLIDK